MTFAARISGVLKLDAATFEEIEANRAVTGQACAVVVLASIASGLGSGGPPDLLEMLDALFLWVAWATVTYVVGTRLLPEPQTESNVGELLRVFGFASAPSFFLILGVVPVVRWLVWIAAVPWTIATTVIAVRQALDYRSTFRAVAVVLLCVIPVAVLRWLIFD